MRTRIGRMTVSTNACDMTGGRGGFRYQFWHTTLEVGCPMDHPAWCFLLLDEYEVEEYIAAWDAFVGHALVVGSIRVGLELERGSDNGAPYTAEQRAAALSRMFRRARPEAAIVHAAFGIFIGEMPPAPALAPTASSVRHLATTG